jgi:hypothetical protein
MLNKRKILGSTKMGDDNKILFLKNAAEFLGMKKGDMITFYEENGKVYIEKGSSNEHFQNF